MFEMAVAMVSCCLLDAVSLGARLATCRPVRDRHSRPTSDNLKILAQIVLSVFTVVKASPKSVEGLLLKQNPVLYAVGCESSALAADIL